jgi:hypothetical protein
MYRIWGYSKDYKTGNRSVLPKPFATVNRFGKNQLIFKTKPDQFCGKPQRPSWIGFIVNHKNQAVFNGFVNHGLQWGCHMKAKI